MITRFYTDQILATFVVVGMMWMSTLCKPIPIPESAKIRIHVPVKHHTHLHTKTVIKTVHVGIPVKPVKTHHESIEDDGWEYEKKKKSNHYLKLINN
ncbi:uncharacterized protein LOC131683102 isoform X3 [Topomyia yanbarensis]|uniref:uncharacterized protein LOC131683102 isoform X3 n=1 Tax=Topomyia yanbarensis TaxID=2498891 RepID=UPI00273B57BA|nr:uncharacterized protein LOC131683102 isoform X3 [Topomyia yanbarensis]